MTNAVKNVAELDAVLKKQANRPNGNNKTKSVEDKKSASYQNRLPKFPEVKPSGDENATSSFWRELRSFYRDAKGGGILDSGKQPRLYPALLSPYRDMRRVRFDYPVWIADDPGVDSKPVITLSELLIEAVKSFAPSDADSKILKDNLARLEMIVRENMDETALYFSFPSVMQAALQKLESQLSIKGTEGKNFADDIQKLKKALPDSGRLISYNHEVPFLLLAAALGAKNKHSKKLITDEAAALRSKLEELIRIEKEKSPEAKAPDTLKGSYGYGASFINFDKFSGVIPEASTEKMSPERLARIEKIAAVLCKADDYFKYDCVAVIEQNFNNRRPEDWSLYFPKASIQIADKRIICTEAQNAFRTHMKSMTELLGAIRIARLEVENHYRTEIHDAYFTGFDWRSLSEDEMSYCPPVLMITPVDELMQHNLTEFSRLLASHKPIKTLVVKSDAQAMHVAESAAEMHFTFSQELGALAVSQRNTYVFQSTTIHPEGLFEGLTRGLTGFSPALFYVLSPKSGGPANPYVWSGAALESRLFPEFTYDLKQGLQWGSRFNVEKNPQAEQNWPMYELEIEDAKGGKDKLSIPFSFADFAGQDIHYADHFKEVPAEFWTDDLILFADYLNMPPTEAYAKIPFVWMVDKENVLHKVAVTHYVALVAQERLDFWHFIQEFGGINSYHVARAIEKVTQELLEEKKKEIAALEEKHAGELDEVRKSTAREAMEKLSGILLDLDTLTVTPSARPAATTAVNEPAVLKTETFAEAPKVEPQEDAFVSSEPWLESFRCTSCNECINVNPNMFKYNSTKQAFIADAKAGTYAQLVKAAEKCPAKCIHPGMPLNSSEAGLDDLIKRAAAFN
jgi:ferredoxin